MRETWLLGKRAMAETWKLPAATIPNSAHNINSLRNGLSAMKSNISRYTFKSTIFLIVKKPIRYMAMRIRKPGTNDGSSETSR